MLCWICILAAIWLRGIWPGPSTITCTFFSQALLVSSPNVTSSSIWETSVASSKHPGRQASPKLMVTSYFWQISRISSKCSQYGFSFPVISIHAKIMEPPLDTMFIRRLFFLKRWAVARLIPMWMVIKSTPSCACISTIFNHSSVVISFSAL